MSTYRLYIFLLSISNPIHYENQVDILIAANAVFHGLTKHMGGYYHFIKERWRKDTLALHSSNPDISFLRISSS